MLQDPWTGNDGSIYSPRPEILSGRLALVNLHSGPGTDVGAAGEPSTRSLEGLHASGSPVTRPAVANESSRPLWFS
jgi:hypothetical protein